MENLPVPLNLTVGQINFLISCMVKQPYEAVAASIGFLQGEQQKAIQLEQDRLADVARQGDMLVLPPSAAPPPTPAENNDE